jgi:hypothetical protein
MRVRLTVRLGSLTDVELLLPQPHCRCDPICDSGARRVAQPLPDRPALGPKDDKAARLAGGFASGETRTRTGDTTIFSRVLYQLSYLALVAGDASDSPRVFACASDEPSKQLEGARLGQRLVEVAALRRLDA